MSLSELLDQDEIWQARDANGDLYPVQLAEMTPDHLANLRAWLLRNASAMQSAELSSLYRMGCLIQGEMALDDLDCAMDQLAEQPPQQWMRGQVLFQKIGRLLGGESQ